MRACFFSFVIALMGLASFTASADPLGRSRVAGYLGAGQASSDSADGRSTIAEGPFSYGFGVDYAWKYSMFTYGEHIRSFADGASSIGFTGIGVKIYPWLNPTEAVGAYAKVSRSLIAVEGTAYYYGGGFGLAQASVPPVNRTPANVAVGPCLSFKAGSERMMSRDWGLRYEFNYMMTVGGSGAIALMNLTIGVSFAL